MDIKTIITEQLATNDFFKGGFLLTILGGIGLWLKSLLPFLKEKILRIISFSSTIESKSELYVIFNRWLSENYPDKFKQVSFSLGEIYGNKPLAEADEISNKNFKLIESNLNSSFIIWYKNKPIFIKSYREKMENASYFESIHLESYVLTTYLSKNIIKDLVNSILNQEAEKEKKKIKNHVYDYIPSYGYEKLQEIYCKPYNKIFNSEKVELLKDINYFLESKYLYEQRGTPYRRGYLLEGKPGNGKTSTVLAIAKKLNKDVYSLNLGCITNDTELKHAFKNIKSNSFLLLEDIDCILDGRNRISEKVNFSTLLNVLDGVFSKNNVITFFTTNHSEKLDDALLREGRIDKRIEFKNPQKENVENMIELFFNEKVNIQKYNSNLNASKIQEILISSKNIEEVLDKLNIKEKIAT